MTKRSKMHETTREDRALGSIMDAEHTDKLWNKLDTHQRAYASAIQKHIVTFVDAPAGTGKTTVAVMVGLEMLRKGLVDQITYMRFPDARNGNLGYLPGDLFEKTYNLMAPFYEAMAECGVQPEAVDLLKSKGIVEMATDTFMRGRNKRAYLIIDESQNAKTVSDLQLVLTRLHDERSRAVVIGHSEQVDGRVTLYGKAKLNAFQAYAYHMTKKSFTAQCELPNNYRGKVSQWADKIAESLAEL